MIHIDSLIESHGLLEQSIVHILERFLVELPEIMPGDPELFDLTDRGEDSQYSVGIVA